MTPIQTDTPEALHEVGAPVFVWGIWILLLVGMLVFVGRHARNLPVYDEWDHVVPYMAGEQRMTPAFLWEQRSEYRVPLAKLIVLPWYKLTGHFRAGLVFTISVLATFAFVLILTARRIRGWTSYSDGFLPLAVLNFGHWDNLLITWFAVNIVFTIFSLSLLIITVTSPSPAISRKAFVAGICLVLLPLSGPAGMLLLPALALWLGCMAVLQWRSGEPSGRNKGLLLLVLVSMATGVAGLYLVGYEIGTGGPLTPGLRATLRASAEYLSMSVGHVAATIWPYSGYGILGLLLLTAIALLKVGLQQPRERFRAFGLGCFMGGNFLIALGIGFGRSGFGYGAGLQPRYLALAFPMLCGVYFIWMLGRDRSHRVAQMALFALMCTMFLPNLQATLAQARYYGNQMDAFDKDLLAGMPAVALAERHLDSLFPFYMEIDASGKLALATIPTIKTRNTTHDYLVERMRMLSRAGVGQFRNLRDKPVMRETPLPVEPHEISQVVWDQGKLIAQGREANSFLVFALPEPQWVAAIRVTGSYEKADALATFRLSWASNAQESFSDKKSARVEHSPTPDETITVWVWDTLDRFLISPDNKACVFTISSITLLLPAND